MDIFIAPIVFLLMVSPVLFWGALRWSVGDKYGGGFLIGIGLGIVVLALCIGQI